MKKESVLGIDVSARKLDLVWSNEGQERHFTVTYDDESLGRLLKEHADIKPQRCVVGMESTGDYHWHAARYFLRRGFEVKVINPLLTKQFVSHTIRGSKTDRQDSLAICKLIRDGQGEPASIADMSNRSRELLRLAKSVTKAKTQLTLRLQSTRRKAIVGTGSVERKVGRVINRLDAVSRDLVTEATKERSREEELIDSIPGFAVKLAAIVHHELGDVSRFKNAKSLVAYAGLDPKIIQSGSSLNVKGRITKRGNPMLRYALFLAANVAKTHDKELREYYLKKRLEGRKHTEVLCMISRKLLYRIWAVLRDQREYVKR